MINAYAYFDCLSICNHIQSNYRNIAIAEIYLFAYLSCLLSLYKKNPISSWEYQFSVTKHGYPYSADLDYAIHTLVSGGFLEGKEKYLNLTDEGKTEYELLQSLEQNRERETFINGACSTSLAWPIGMIRKSIANDPEIKSAVDLSQTRMLLEDVGLDIIYKQFATLSSVIGIDVDELMVPALIWLTFLSEP